MLLKILAGLTRETRNWTEKAARMVNLMSMSGFDGRQSLEWMQQQQQTQALGFPEQMRFLALFIAWMAATIARALLFILPSKIHFAGLTDMLDNVRSSNPLVMEDGPGNAAAASLIASRGVSTTSTSTKNTPAVTFSKGSAISRALSRALELVNDTPASSRKYVFVRELADRLIHENAAHGVESLKEVNRIVLKEGFSRKIFQLSRYLEGIKHRQHVDALAWPWRFIKGIPVGAATSCLSAVPWFGSIGSYLGSSWQSASKNPQQPAASGNPEVVENEEMAEKLAQELGWMTDKLNGCSALDDAIIQWSEATSLASQSLYADPPIQRSLVKLSVMLCRGIACGDYDVPSETLAQLLLLWLPLLCTAIGGIEGPIFSSYEKAEAERMLEQAIFLLPESKQEMVLAVWLREFSQSPSDWPNLKSCYCNWCNISRKLDLLSMRT